MIKKRNILAVYLLSFITFGIYLIYWQVQTKKEMNSLGAEIPTAWLLIVPVANIYWMYKYCEAFSNFVKRDNNAVMWFLLYFFVGIIMPAVVQSGLNNLAVGGQQPLPQQPVQQPIQQPVMQQPVQPPQTVQPTPTPSYPNQGDSPANTASPEAPAPAPQDDQSSSLPQEPGNS